MRSDTRKNKRCNESSLRFGCSVGPMKQRGEYREARGVGEKTDKLRSSYDKGTFGMCLILSTITNTRA